MSIFTPDSLRLHLWRLPWKTPAMGINNKAWGRLHERLVDAHSHTINLYGLAEHAYPSLASKPIQAAAEFLFEEQKLHAYETEELLKVLCAGGRPQGGYSSQAAFFARCRLGDALVMLEKLTRCKGVDHCPFPSQTPTWDEAKMEHWLLYDMWWIEGFETMILLAFGSLTSGPTAYR